MRALRYSGLVVAWAAAGVLWLILALAIFSIVWFTWFGPEETAMMASIWLIIGLTVGCPAVLLTARLGGFWNRLFRRPE